MSDLYKEMSERDLLIAVATRQEEMTERLERIENQLLTMNGRIDAHGRAISRIHGVGGMLALFYSGIIAVLGWFLRR